MKKDYSDEEFQRSFRLSMLWFVVVAVAAHALVFYYKNELEPRINPRLEEEAHDCLCCNGELE